MTLLPGTWDRRGAGTNGLPVGAAAGAGLIVPAAFATGAYFLVVVVYAKVIGRLRLSGRRYHVLHVTYVDGTGSLREILQSCTGLGFQILGFTTGVPEHGGSSVMDRVLNGATAPTSANLVEVELEIEGLGSRHVLLDALSGLPTIKAVSFDDENE